MYESQHTELKRQLKDDLLKWISAFANAFFRAGLIESWGRGIERINRACEQESTPAPTWQLETGGVWVTFDFVAEHAGQTAGGVSGGVSGGVNDVFNFIENNPGLSAVALSQQLGITLRTLQRALKTLKEQGKISHKGAPKTGGYWPVKSEAKQHT